MVQDRLIKGRYLNIKKLLIIMVGVFTLKGNLSILKIGEEGEYLNIEYLILRKLRNQDMKKVTTISENILIKKSMKVYLKKRE